MLMMPKVNRKLMIFFWLKNREKRGRKVGGREQAMHGGPVHNFSTQKAEVGQPCGQLHARMHSEIKSSLGYLARC